MGKSARNPGFLSCSDYRCTNKATNSGTVPGAMIIGIDVGLFLGCESYRHLNVTQCGWKKQTSVNHGQICVK